MADILLDAQGNPTSPAANTGLIYPSLADKQFVGLCDDGRRLMLPGLKNFNTADEVANAANTYLAGSKITIPQHGLAAGMMFRWKMGLTKTGAGVATPAWTVVVGTNGSTADTVRLTFTGPAQTANADAGLVEIIAILRNTGASGVLAGILTMDHNGNTLGLANVPQVTLQATSAGFDTTPASLKVGVCINPGAAGVWTHQVIMAELLNG